MDDSTAHKTCEDIPLLISRSLDRDLEKSETLSLYHHIAQCAECRARLDSMLALESGLSELNRTLEPCCLNHEFNTKLWQALAAKPQAVPLPPSPSPSVWRRLRKSLGFKGPYQGPLFAGIGVAALVLAVMVGQAPRLKPPMEPPMATAKAEHLVVHEIPFQQSTDEMKWNYQQTIPPRHDLRLVIDKQDAQPYYFRLSAPEQVQVVVIYAVSGEVLAQTQYVTLRGVRYATLKSPHRNDVILIRNQGSGQMNVDAYAPSAQTFQVGIQQIKY